MSRVFQPTFGLKTVWETTTLCQIAATAAHSSAENKLDSDSTPATHTNADHCTIVAEVLVLIPVGGSLTETALNCHNLFFSFRKKEDA